MYSFFEYWLINPVSASISVGLCSSACLLAGRFDMLSVRFRLRNNLFSRLSLRLSLRLLASSSAFLDNSFHIAMASSLSVPCLRSRCWVTSCLSSSSVCCSIWITFV